MNATLTCGTLRCNRKGVPQALKNAHPAKGKISVFNNRTLVALKYSDKKDVSLLTTINEGVMTDAGKRGKDGNRILRPDCVVSYNKYMGAVDRCDQMVSYSGFDRGTLKWWEKVFFYVLCIVVLNTYIIYKEMTRRPVLHRVFREVIRQLVMESGITGPESRGRKRAAGDNLQRLSARHFLGHLPPTGTKTAARRCVVCGPGEAEVTEHSNQEGFRHQKDLEGNQVSNASSVV